MIVADLIEKLEGMPGDRVVRIMPEPWYSHGDVLDAGDVTADEDAVYILGSDGAPEGGE